MSKKQAWMVLSIGLASVVGLIVVAHRLWFVIIEKSIQ